MCIRDRVGGAKPTQVSRRDCWNLIETILLQWVVRRIEIGITAIASSSQGFMHEPFQGRIRVCFSGNCDAWFREWASYVKIIENRYSVIFEDVLVYIAKSRDAAGRVLDLWHSRQQRANQNYTILRQYHGKIFSYLFGQDWKAQLMTECRKFALCAYTNCVEEPVSYTHLTLPTILRV